MEKFYQSFQDTISFFGYNFRTLIIAIIYVLLNVIVQWLLRGGEAMKEDVMAWLSPILLAIAVFAVLFVRNLYIRFEVSKAISMAFKPVKIKVISYTLPTNMAANNPVELKLILKIRNPPKQLGELKLCLSRGKIDPTYPNLSSVLPLRLTDKVNYITVKFESPFDIYKQSISSKSPNMHELKYHIQAQVGGKPYPSREHILDNIPYY